jgi:hypothetical protein
MKRAIIPEQPVPASLAALQQHVQAAGLQVSSSTSTFPLYTGPVSSLQTGDYVAVLVRQLSGTSTLLSQPLAKTSVQEFAQVFGSTTPGVQQLPPWLQAGDLAGSQWVEEGLEAAAGA